MDKTRKLLKAVSIMAAACLSALLLTGCFGGKSDDAFTLVIGVDENNPPYTFINQNTEELDGFDIDLAEEVCERNGWNLKVKKIDWEDKQDKLNDGKITCIWSGVVVEGNESKYAFTDPYMVNEQVVIAKNDSGLYSLDDLENKAVVTQKTSASLDVLNNSQLKLSKTFASLEQVSNYEKAFEQLDSGETDAVACDLSVAAYYMSMHPDTYILLGSLSVDHYGVAFEKGSEDLAKTVTETLRAMDEDGTIEFLCENYARYGLTYQNWCLE